MFFFRFGKNAIVYLPVCQVNYSYISGLISTGVGSLNRVWPRDSEYGWTIVPAFPGTGTEPKFLPTHRNVIEGYGFF